MHNVTSEKTCRILTVEIAVPAVVPEGEISDGISALLTDKPEAEKA